jgi:hypothetical protein
MSPPGEKAPVAEAETVGPEEVGVKLTGSKEDEKAATASFSSYWVRITLPPNGSLILTIHREYSPSAPDEMGICLWPALSAPLRPARYVDTNASKPHG